MVSIANASTVISEWCCSVLIGKVTKQRQNLNI